MKAATVRRYGSPEVLAIEEVPTPAPGAGQVLVRVAAVPVTVGDLRLRTADFPGISWLPGLLMMGITGPRAPIPGTQFAGRVVAIGSGVTRFAVGDEVFGSSDDSACAELLVVAEDGPVARIPRGVSYEEAAATPYGAVTALLFLRDHLQVRPGERVAILGATGGVGRFAVAVARHLGAEVTAVCSPGRFALARSLGVDHVMDRGRDLSVAGPFDVVFDTSGAVGFGQVRGAMTPTGRYATLHASLAVLAGLFLNRWRSQQVRFGLAFGGREDLEAVADLLGRGVLRPTLGTCYPLARVADAHAEATRRSDACVVVQVTPPEALRAVG